MTRSEQRKENLISATEAQERYFQALINNGTVAFIPQLVANKTDLTISNVKKHFSDCVIINENTDHEYIVIKVGQFMSIYLFNIGLPQIQLKNGWEELKGIGTVEDLITFCKLVNNK